MSRTKWEKLYTPDDQLPPSPLDAKLRDARPADVLEHAKQKIRECDKRIADMKTALADEEKTLAAWKQLIGRT